MIRTMNDKGKIDKLILSHLSGRIEIWEVKELIQWINSAPENRKKFELIKNFWQNSQQKVEIDASRLNSAFDKVMSKSSFTSEQSDASKQVHFSDRVDSPKIYTKPSFKNYVSIAASIVLVLGIGFGVFQNSKIEQTSNVEALLESTMIYKKNPLGQKTNFRLPDGSEVWLNAGSELSFKKSFSENKREVFLKGEGYFKVTKDAERPFYVITDDFKVRALGTSFNINSYPGNSKHSVALLTGKVAVEMTKKNSGSHLLTPGMGLKYDVNATKFEEFLFDSEEVSAWKNGLLIFQNSDFATVVDKLEKWYGVNVIARGTPPKDFVVSGRFNNEYMSNVLRSLKYGRSFDYKINNKDLIITFQKQPKKHGRRVK
ncbi:MAG: FecR domain-containing protein [Reichenbachiella sp.]